MPIETLEIGAPFFGLRLVQNEVEFQISGRAIALNLGVKPLVVREQRLPPLTSAILQDAAIADIEACLIVDGFEPENDAETMAQIRETWPTAYALRGEARLKGVEHYMSPKVWVGQRGFTFYHSASVPLNVGLHREHPFCPLPGFREVHTQILGLGKMQQCREKDPATLYLEEIMAPGHTHRPMFDADGTYPWHQFETITPSVFLAIEMLPEGATPPEIAA